METCRCTSPRTARRSTIRRTPSTGRSTILSASSTTGNISERRTTRSGKESTCADILRGRSSIITSGRSGIPNASASFTSITRLRRERSNRAGATMRASSRATEINCPTERGGGSSVSTEGGDGILFGNNARSGCPLAGGSPNCTPSLRSVVGLLVARWSRLCPRPIRLPCEVRSRSGHPARASPARRPFCSTHPRWPLAGASRAKFGIPAPKGGSRTCRKRNPSLEGCASLRAARYTRPVQLRCCTKGGAGVPTGAFQSEREEETRERAERVSAFRDSDQVSVAPKGNIFTSLTRRDAKEADAVSPAAKSSRGRQEDECAGDQRSDRHLVQY
jgi:hypothetical protein